MGLVCFMLAEKNIGQLAAGLRFSHKGPKEPIGKSKGLVRSPTTQQLVFAALSPKQTSFWKLVKGALGRISPSWGVGTRLRLKRHGSCKISTGHLDSELWGVRPGDLENNLFFFFRVGKHRVLECLGFLVVFRLESVLLDPLDLVFLDVFFCPNFDLEDLEATENHRKSKEFP